MRAAARRALLSSTLAAALLPAAAGAHADGREINRSATGCGSVGLCHGANPGATATLTGPMTVAAGARSTYTLTIRSSLPTFTGGGFDVGARGPAGTALAPDPARPDTRLNAADLVMNARLAAAGGAVAVTFDLVTPAAGDAVITAAGNATNGVGSAGDAWALATLAVRVAAAPAPDAGAAPDATVGADAPAAVDVAAPVDRGAADVAAARDAPAARDVPAARAADSGPEAYDVTASYGYGGCAVGGRARGGAGAFAALAWALVRRRRRADA